MAPIPELQKLQTKIGNSFLRAFYPVDYRSNQNILKNVDELLQQETKGLRTLSSTTSSVNQKIGKVLTGMRDEMDALRAYFENTQSSVRAGEEVVANASRNAENASNSLIDLLIAEGLDALLDRRSRNRGRTPGGTRPPPTPDRPGGNKPPPPPDTPDRPKSRFSIPRGLTIVALAYGLWTMWEELQALDPNMKKGEYRQAVLQIVSRAVASFGLMWVGAFIGAAVGSVFFGIGAVPGFIVGMISGAALDYVAGDTVDAIVDQVVDYFYTGDEEEEGVPTPEELAAAEAAVQMREPPVPTPPLEPVQQQVSEQVAANIPLAPPIMGPTPPTPPMQQMVDSPVEYPGPVSPMDLVPFAAAASAATTATAAVNEAMNRAETTIPVVTGTDAQNQLMDQTYGPNRPTSQTNMNNQPGGTQATFNTASNQAGGIEIQPGQGVGSVQVIEAYGPNRPGRPVQAIRDIAVRAAESVGMTQIKFTSGVGDYISDERRRGGQKTTKHSEGIALDVTGFANQAQRVAFMQAARQLGAGGIGAYNNGSVHIDLGPAREWDGAVGVPGLAEGAKVSKPTLALIGEGGEPEYVVPQSKAIKFAHEMVATRPQYRTKKRTHVVVVPILT
jgi:hypothetical protein